MSSYVKELAVDLLCLIRGIPHTIRHQYRWYRYRLLDCRYVALVEVVKGGVSVGMMRTPSYRWHWVAKLVARGVSYKLRDKGDEFIVRVTDPIRAQELEHGYSVWQSARPR